MWRQRFVRFFIISLVTLLVLGLVSTLIDRQQNSDKVGFHISLKEKLEDFGEKVLGAAVKKLPKAPDLEKIGSKEPTGEDGQEVEPIEEPVKNIQDLIDELVISIKKLPQDQLEAVKKQIYKKLSEELTKE